MNRIVRENYPVANLPENLREGFAVDALVTVTITVMPESPIESVLVDPVTLLSPPWLTREEIAAQIDDIREDRDL